MSTVQQALPDGWTIQLSSKTGKQYYFNKRTGQSVYEAPVEVVATLSAAPTSIPTLQAQSAGSSVHATSDVNTSANVCHFGSASTATEAVAISEQHMRAGVTHPPGLYSANPVDFRAAVEAICAQLDLERSRAGPGTSAAVVQLGHISTAVAPVSGARITSYSFPVCDKARRLIIHDLADEFSLKSYSEMDEIAGDKFVTIYLPGHPTPAVIRAEEEEVRLAAEAAARREAEVRAAHAAAAEIRSARGDGGAGGRPRGRGGRRSAAPHAIEPPVPVRAPPRDKRTIAEIQEDLKVKRARLEGQ